CSAICQRGGGVDGRENCANLRPLPLEVGEQIEGRQAVGGGEGQTEGSCGGEGAELVFAFAPRAAGTLALSVTTEVSSLDATLYVRAEACGDASSEAPGACRNDGGTGDPEGLDLPVEAGKTYFVFVDARGEGEVTLGVRLDEGGGCEGEGEACDTTLEGDCAAGTLTCVDNRYLVCRANEEGCG
ncbi:MAG TPA: hypothetical protein VFS00_03125, partial [Polyangiaceae bacterium]|nr:hypothetical protein [Polyangiaceae bacterium]